MDAHVHVLQVQVGPYVHRAYREKHEVLWTADGHVQFKVGDAEATGYSALQSMSSRLTAAAAVLE